MSYNYRQQSLKFRQTVLQCHHQRLVSSFVCVLTPSQTFPFVSSSLSLRFFQKYFSCRDQSLVEIIGKYRIIVLILRHHDQTKTRTREIKQRTHSCRHTHKYPEHFPHTVMFCFLLVSFYKHSTMQYSSDSNRTQF